MSGEVHLPSNGEVRQVRVDKQWPAVVVKTDQVRDPRIRSFLVVSSQADFTAKAFRETSDSEEEPSSPEAIPHECL